MTQLLQKKVLIVDDDPAINALLMNALSDKFDAVSLGTGKSAIEYCSSHQPDAILLDVNLGDLDGRVVCHELKQKMGDDAPPVIFISGDSSDETILSCFDQGGDDFISKPFSSEQVKQKVTSLFKYDTLFRNLKSHSEELSDLVSSTMTQASSYGAVLQAVKNLNHCNTESEIANCIFQYLATEGLTAAVYFKNGEQSLCFDQKSKICSPIVKEVFELTHNKTRLYKLKNRLVVSDKHVSVLIKNPPAEDDEKYGVFIDIVAVLIEALEARYMSYLREQELTQLHGELTGVIFDLHTSVEDVRAKKQQLIDDIVLRIGLSFHQLDLSEDQEDFFAKMLEDTVMTHDDNNNVIMDLQNRLQVLVEEINELVKKEPEKQEVQADESDAEDNFELF